MNTINTNAAPKAPTYIADLWQLEESKGTFLKFKFRTEASAIEMEKEITLDPLVVAFNRVETIVSIHYVDRYTMQHSAKAISNAYGIELI